MDLQVTVRGSGPVRVVFVHGVLDRGRSFDRVADLLDDECHMLWYDRRGYGASVDAAGAPVGVDGHVDDLIDILEGRPAVVVGHSFGGNTVVGAALRAPELVAAVAIYETGMPWIPGWDDTFLRSVLWGEDPEGEGVRMMFRERYDEMSDDERDRRRRLARAFVAEERSVRTGTPPFDLGRLRPPLVFGYSGGAPFAGVSEHLQRVVPHAEEVVMTGAGHNAHRDAPEAFADLVRRAMARARAPA